jgi:hypothetical protein
MSGSVQVLGFSGTTNLSATPGARPVPRRLPVGHRRPRLGMRSSAIPRPPTGWDLPPAPGNVPRGAMTDFSIARTRTDRRASLRDSERLNQR